MSDVPTILENTSITVPLDVLLELVEATQAREPSLLSDQTADLLKVEIIGTLEALPELSETDVARIVRRTFGETPGAIEG